MDLRGQQIIPIIPQGTNTIITIAVSAMKDYQPDHSRLILMPII